MNESLVCKPTCSWFDIGIGNLCNNLKSLSILKIEYFKEKHTEIIKEAFEMDLIKKKQVDGIYVVQFLGEWVQARILSEDLNAK